MPKENKFISNFVKINLNNTVLKSALEKHHKVRFYNNTEFDLSPNVAIAKIAEDLFKELISRYPNYLIEANREVEGYTLKSLAATPVKRARVNESSYQPSAP